MSALGCLSCAHSSREEDGRLMCGKIGFPAVSRCRWFEYEPGTDEETLE